MHFVFAAQPPAVRKGSAFPGTLHFDSSPRLSLGEVFQGSLSGKAEPYRTGTAAEPQELMPNYLRQRINEQINLVLPQTQRRQNP